MVPVALGFVAVALIAFVVVQGFGESTPSEDGDAQAEVASASPAIIIDRYIGRPIAEVEAEADENGWQITKTEVREDGTIAGQVLAQEPAPGQPLANGGTLTLAVSSGQELQTVPSIVGRTVPEAEAILSEANLSIGAVTQRHDDDAPLGEVLALRVDGDAPRSELETDTAVDLVVSAGPATQPMPSFVGLSLDRALRQAEELGLVVIEDEGFSERYDTGMIIHTEPPTDALVKPGDELVLVVSKGQPFVTIPDVVGLSQAEASAQLTAAGFIVVDGAGPEQIVTATSPASGETFRKGTTVVLQTNS